MLKKIPHILSPELLKVLCEMGHSDEIIISDGNFPACGLNKNIIRLDGHGTCEVLDAILELFPLDSYTDNVIMMEVMKGDNVQTPIWDEYEKILSKKDDNYKIKHIDRFEFYERTKSAYAVITTSESALYANILLKKGIVK